MDVTSRNKREGKYVGYQKWYLTGERKPLGQGKLWMCEKRHHRRSVYWRLYSERPGAKRQPQQRGIIYSCIECLGYEP